MEPSILHLVFDMFFSQCLFGPCEAPQLDTETLVVYRAASEEQTRRGAPQHVNVGGPVIVFVI
jgi:hypothetical protein